MKREGYVDCVLRIFTIQSALTSGSCWENFEVSVGNLSIGFRLHILVNSCLWFNDCSRARYDDDEWLLLYTVFRVLYSHRVILCILCKPYEMDKH